MRRRVLLALLPLLTLAHPATAATGGEDYTPGLAEKAMAAGEVILLDFHAPWCSTCRAQERVLDELRSENPAYDEAIRFIIVDWDTYGAGDLARSLEVPRRSTLIVLKGAEELGRTVASTSRDEIKALLDAGLSAVGR